MDARHIRVVRASPSTRSGPRIHEEFIIIFESLEPKKSARAFNFEGLNDQSMSANDVRMCMS